MSAPHNDTKINTDNNFAIVAKPAEIYTEWSGSSRNITGIEVSITSIQNTMSAIGQDYENVGAVTLDGIFCPYTTESGHASLPYWEVSTNSGVINQSLNPFFPDQMLAKTGISNSIESIYYESGSNIAGYNSFTGVGKDTEGDLNPYVDIVDNGKMNVFARGVGLKTPLILSGWGYDIEGNPVPADTGDSTIFASEAFRDPSLWKSGPLDVRWDDDRKVWTFDNGGVSNSGTTSILDCGCTFLEVGTRSCMSGTNNAPEVMVINSLGFLGDNIELSYLSDCVYSGVPIAHNCTPTTTSGPTTTAGPTTTVGVTGT